MWRVKSQSWASAAAMLVVILLSLLATASALKCYTCRSSSTDKTNGCLDLSSAKELECTSGEEHCQKVIVDEIVSRGCFGGSLNPNPTVGCSETGSTTKCVCDSELCNGSEKSVAVSIVTLISAILAAARIL